MTNEELIAEVKSLRFSIKRIERDIGMAHNLHKYYKDPSKLPVKLFDKLITYVRLKKVAPETEWGKLVLENESLRAKLRALEDEMVIIRSSANSWDELMSSLEKSKGKTINNIRNG